MQAREQGKRPLAIALGLGVAFLVLLGFVASVARGVGTVVSVARSAGPPPELSPIDRVSVRVIALLLDVEPGTDAYRDADEQNRRFLGKFNRHPTATLLHVVAAALFIALAPLQFSRRIRSRHVGWHRWSGRAIVALAIPLCLSGLWFGLRMPFAGAVEASAVGLFGAMFLVFLTRGFLAIRKRDIAHHREWMIRMWAVALGVSMQRVVGTILLAVMREGPDAWFGVSIWIGFATTVAIAELWIRHTRRLAGEPSAVAAMTPLSLGFLATQFGHDWPPV